MRKVIFYVLVISCLIDSYAATAAAIEVAPRISDREIVERLSRLEEGQKRLETKIEAMDQRIDDLRSEMIARFDSMDKRFDLLTWVFGLFITIALLILGFLLRMQWQMQTRQTRIETSLETQKDEMMFLKKLIDKLLPPKGAL